MKKVDNKKYEIDLFDVFLIIIGFGLIILGFVSQSCGSIIGLAILGILVWSPKILKFLCIILGIVSIILLSNIVDFISASELFLISLGYDTIIINYLMFWPAIISATISIFSVLYAIKKNKTYLYISSSFFLICSGLIASYNTMTVIDDPTIESLVVLWIINFVVYVFAYIITFTMFYYISTIFQILVHKLDDFALNRLYQIKEYELQEKNIYNKKEELELSGKKYDNSQGQIRREDDIAPDVLKARLKSRIMFTRSLIFLIISAVGIFLVGYIYDGFIEQVSVESENFLVINQIILMGFFGFVGCLLIAILNFIKKYDNFVNSGILVEINFILLGFFAGMFLYSKRLADFSSDPTIERFSIVFLVLIVLIGIQMFFCLSHILTLRYNKPRMRKFDPYQDIIMVSVIGMLLLIITLIVVAILWPTFNNNGSEPGKLILCIAILCFLIFDTGLTLVSSGVIKSFNRIAQSRYYLWSLKSTFDMISTAIILFFNSNENFQSIHLKILAGVLIFVGITSVIAIFWKNCSKNKKRFNSKSQKRIQKYLNHTENVINEDKKQNQNEFEELKTKHQTHEIVSENDEKYLF